MNEYSYNNIKKPSSASTFAFALLFYLWFSYLANFFFASQKKN